MKKSMIPVLFWCILLLTGCSSGKLPETPCDFTAESTENGIVLTWSEVNTADSYRLYRRKTEQTDYRFLSDTTGLTYTDASCEDGCTYIYKLTTMNDSGESAGTETTQTFRNASDTAVLAAPVITSVTRMDSYTTVILFEDANTDCQYKILRAGSRDGTYTVAGTTDEKVFYDETENSSSWYQVCAVSGETESEVSLPAETGTNACEVFCVPIFMYHDFVTEEDLSAGVAFDEYAIYKDDFESDLNWLKSNGYTTITTKELTDYLEGNGSMPQKPVILTIDDGKLGVYKNAWPLLREYGMKASLALIGENIDAATADPSGRKDDPAPYCTWEEVREMSDSGAMEMVSHTYTLHAFDHDGRQGANCAEGEDLSQFFLPALNDFRMMQKKLLEVTGRETVTLSYPYSIRSTISDKVWLKCGYRLLVAGKDDDVRKTQINCFVREAGINAHSALARRIVRMHGTSIETYMQDALAQDAQANP